MNKEMTPPTVVVSGVGVLTCLGRGLEVHRLALRGGEVVLGPPTLLEAPALAGSPVGQVPEAALEGAPVEAPRVLRLGLCAARDALGGAALSGRGVLVVGTTTGNVLESERDFARARAAGAPDPLRHLRHHPVGDAALELGAALGLDAECHTFVTACSSSSNAVGYGALRVRGGAPWALVGGVDTLCLMTWAGFHALRLLSRGPTRPFDATRSGVSVAEGAAFLLLETAEAAAARGATVFGEVQGWGCAVDAYHQTAPDPEGVGMLASMRGALEEAGVAPAGVAYVNAHGTGTEANDRVESLAVQRLFGSARPLLSSTKSLTGHTLGAAGAVEAALCLAALRDGRAPATAGLRQPDPACDVAHVPPGGAPLPGDVLLSNSFGFGGNNASLVLRGARAVPAGPARPPRGEQPVRAFVHGLGVVAPGALGATELAARLREPAAPLPLPPHFGDARDRRLARLSRLERMALAAAKEALGDHPAEGTALVVGSAYAMLRSAHDFLEGLSARGVEHGSPFAFYQSVYHALAGQLGIQLGLKGVGLTASARELSGESALRVGLDLLASGKVERVLVVAADDARPPLADLLPPGHPAQAVEPSGAAALLLARAPSALAVRRCTLARHPAARDALPSPGQARGLLAPALDEAGPGAAASPFLDEPLGPWATDDGRRFGLNPSGGMLRTVAALLRLQDVSAPPRALVHGLALGGGQAVTLLERVAP